MTPIERLVGAFNLNCHGWLAFLADRDLLVVSLNGCSAIKMSVKPEREREEEETIKGKAMDKGNMGAYTLPRLMISLTFVTGLILMAAIGVKSLKLPST